MGSLNSVKTFEYQGNQDVASRVSAAMDSDLSEAELANWLAGLGDNPLKHSKQVWDEYHLIGDVIRSTDLTPPDLADSFAQRFAMTFENEPIHFPKAAISAKRYGWIKRVTPGVAAVATVALVAWNMSSPRNSATTVPAQIAKSSDSVSTQMAEASMNPMATVQTVVTANGAVTRDVRFDQYLEAHQQLAPRAPIMGAGLVVRTANSANP
ncbi:sigma-E factor negative regulatory protein [Ampullimonas aquatilis]|uniref:sigma-E factor negative regulatory protein n=1 Tax=Ampullimonas aquatilis TaxID=1341549 RepID=UPI003C743BF7